MNKEIIKPDERLLCAASFVRHGSIVADVGTDHAYLPIWLLHRGICTSAVATDIAKGPILRAKENIETAGMSDKIFTLHTDGLCGAEAYYPTDIVICGMGGELIVKIISAAEFVKNEKIRLILQPMTRGEILRKYLLDGGFNIISEKLSKAENRVYQCICAEYDGKKREYSDIELLLGKHIPEKKDIFYELARQKTVSYEQKISGMKLAGLDTAKEEKILSELYKIQKENK